VGLGVPSQEVDGVVEDEAQAPAGHRHTGPLVEGLMMTTLEGSRTSGQPLARTAAMPARAVRNRVSYPAWSTSECFAVVPERQPRQTVAMQPAPVPPVPVPVRRRIRLTG
jgi:hypothetical protein